MSILDRIGIDLGTPAPSDAAAMARAASDAGARLARVRFALGTRSGVDDGVVADAVAIAEALLANGLRVIGVVDGGLTVAPEGLGESAPDELANAWAEELAENAAALAAALGDRVAAWEILPAPNAPDGPRQTAARWATAVDGICRAIAAAAPSAERIAGGLWNDESDDGVDFLRTAARAAGWHAGRPPFDGLGIQLRLFRDGGPSEGTVAATLAERSQRLWRAATAALGDDAMGALWVTGIAWDAVYAGESAQARNAWTALDTFTANPDVAAVIWSGLVDAEGATGLYASADLAPDHRRPAWRAFKDFALYASQISPAPQILIDEPDEAFAPSTAVAEAEGTGTVPSPASTPAVIEIIDPEPVGTGDDDAADALDAMGGRDGEGDDAMGGLGEDDDVMGTIDEAGDRGDDAAVGAVYVGPGAASGTAAWDESEDEPASGADGAVDGGVADETATEADDPFGRDVGHDDEAPLEAGLDVAMVPDTAREPDLEVASQATGDSATVGDALAGDGHGHGKGEGEGEGARGDGDEDGLPLEAAPAAAAELASDESEATDAAHGAAEPAPYADDAWGGEEMAGDGWPGAAVAGDESFANAEPEPDVELAGDDEGMAAESPDVPSAEEGPAEAPPLDVAAAGDVFDIQPVIVGASDRAPNDVVPPAAAGPADDEPMHDAESSAAAAATAPDEGEPVLWSVPPNDDEAAAAGPDADEAQPPLAVAGDGSDREDVPRGMSPHAVEATPSGDDRPSEAAAGEPSAYAERMEPAEAHEATAAAASDGEPAEDDRSSPGGEPAPDAAAHEGAAARPTPAAASAPGVVTVRIPTLADVLRGQGLRGEALEAALRVLEPRAGGAGHLPPPGDYAIAVAAPRVAPEAAATGGGLTNQDVLSALYRAGGGRWALVERAGLDLTRLVSERAAAYEGPAVTDLPGLSDAERQAVRAAMA